MMNKFRYSTIAASLLLAACGDSSDSVSEQPTTPELAPSYDNITVDVTPNSTLEGELYVYLGRVAFCRDDERYCDANGNNTLTTDDSQYVITVNADDLKAHFAQSINSTLFAAGQYSLLDLLLYISDVRDDFQLELGEFDDSIGTYRFSVSFDANQDGEFSIDDGIENFENSNWYPRLAYTEGDFKRDGGGEPEATYERTEEWMLRPNVEVRMQPYSQAMTDRREWVQAREVARLAEHGGKVVIPEVVADFGDGRGYVAIAHDVEVKAYNLRPDLWQPGTLSMTDLMMTLHHEYGIDVGLTFWPTLGTGSNVESYAITSINGQRARGFEGWSMHTGEHDAGSDFFKDLDFFENETVPLEAMVGSDGKYCTWLPQPLSADDASDCKADWGERFGGNTNHQMPDTWLLTYPHEIVEYKWAAMWPMWENTEQNVPEDGKFSIYDISQAVAPLTEDHFGWKIADCSLCHSIDNIHLNGDSPILPSTAEPYFCASCHSNNGAPQGHGEESRCHWCHSNDLLMPNHGKASLKVNANTVECAEGLSQEQGPCANHDGIKKRPVHDAARNLDKYDDTLKVLGNSDWVTDQQFPDPYSCLTCHTNN
ncbi:hypothetical protein [Ferrimonas lipolytica]|uniref:Uncharacterized protein n=1 Tax=Ferrimonas lipolytica TaxID=2724191 RepID=A0A6H1UB11_9GAMM|nr:hypothetical protein [Ferrimonas lipolytica]QIZ76255.1 hypothetical protein HER31_04715 [Ferrimonas lipolytica]